MNSIQDFVIPNDIIIAIPAYRAEKELAKFLPYLLTFIPSSQIIVLIDGDYDSSQSVCEQYLIRTIVHIENQGKGAAISTLFRNLSKHYRWIITMDADGQHIPEDLPQFLKKIDQATSDCAVVVGSRDRKGSSMPFARKCSNGLTSWFISLVTGQKIDDSQCGYRAYRSSIVTQCICRYTRFEMESEILIRCASMGETIVSVPISTVYNGGVSHISHVKDTLRWIRAVIFTSIDVYSSKGKK